MEDCCLRAILPLMNKISFVLFFTVFIDMMGFSVIFPIFPETLKAFLAKSGDPVLGKFIDLTRIIMETSSGDWSLFVALFGGIVASLYSLLQFVFAPIWGKFRIVSVANRCSFLRALEVFSVIRFGCSPEVFLFSFFPE